MSSVAITRKGLVTIPRHIRDELGMTAGSKVEFALVDDHVRMRLVRKGSASRIEDGPGILDYAGPRIPISDLRGVVAVKKGARRARH